ncbi:hypothetical protein GCM10011369_14290 [Neiella marina]|uniref:Multidrug transporter n=1 Tax=Neiella marina TaxID=508461 RepID=A0A8J2XNN5_9GAMM|nr:SapC family protein [Neiella marina]GGA73654.1 hypothetical protein GCM10011369_14290 [Neiella marina]
MSKQQILNNVEHANLKVNSKRSAAFGDDKMCVSLTFSEIRNAQSDHPIFFHKDHQNGVIYPMAMLGLEEGQNLSLTEQGWNDSFQPAMIEKGPFKIGKQQRSNGEEGLIVSVDVDDPRVGLEHGERLFMPHGGNTEYTNRIVDVLHRLHSERELTNDFCLALDKLKLLDPLALEFKDASGENVRLSGFFVINEELLNKLPAADLEALAKPLYLHGAYMCIASLSNISKLISKHNKAGAALVG